MACIAPVTIVTMCGMYHADSSIIDVLGGTGQVAGLCDVSSQAVSKWRRTGIPKAQRKFLRAVRPEVFEPEKDAPETKVAA